MDQPQDQGREPVTNPPTANLRPDDQDPATLGAWFSANYAQLLFVGVIVALLTYFKVNVLDVLKAGLGLGLVIFIHELGHFLAAKFCDVHVETFSIGFGKPLPFCSFKFGETTYKLGWIPLGGYVKMVGEGENADTEEAEEDPRSFKNKAVWQRMLIISAGVIMNLLLGGACFMYAYSHGVEEPAAIIGGVSVGSPAWQDGVVGDRQILEIDDVKKPTYEDVRPQVMSVAKDGTIRLVLADRNGNPTTLDIAPRKGADDLFPTIGIQPLAQLVLQKSIRGGPVVQPNSPAAKANQFQPGDKIIGTTNPANPSEITVLPKDDRDVSGTKYDATEYFRREYQLRGKPMTVRVERSGSTLDVPLEPTWTKVLPGVRFQMGRIAAIRKVSPAASAKVVGAEGEPSLQPTKPDEAGSGDRIIALEINVDGKKRRYVDELSKEAPAGVEEVLFDAPRLPHDMEVWAESAKDLTVLVTVLRPPTKDEKVGKRTTFSMQWDPALVFNGETVLSVGSPIALSGLGLAYYVEATFDRVDPQSAAAKAGLQKGDTIAAVRWYSKTKEGEIKADSWNDVKYYQGAFIHESMQHLPEDRFDVKVKRGDADVEIALTVSADESWPAVDRGFYFPTDSRVRKADNVWEALQMGLHRTLRTVNVIYQTLYATVFRQISAKTMSGPLTIANVSYKIAGYDIWQFIIFIGLININLAVVNFLPIPVLDGGHMVFLIYEKIRGKPAPERVIEAAAWIGLGLILLLMLFVISLDVRRLFF